MIPIPEELLEQIERGNVLLFVGERILRDAAGQVALDQLAAQLASRAGLADTVDLSFPEAAQAYEDTAGRQALLQFVRDQFDALGDQPQPVHRLIAGLADCTLFVTTCLDRRLERAFAEAGRPLDVVVGNLDIAFEDERKPCLYRLRGALDRVETLVLTEDDQEMFFEDQGSISVVLQGYLARKTILFVGFDLADAEFKRLYRKVTAPLDDYARRAYAFGEAPAARVTGWCKRHGIAVVEADATAFLEALQARLVARVQPAPRPSPLSLEHPEALPEHPYKLLDYYDTADTAIFFGRREETQTLSSLIHGHRLVVVYGASGVGKTSLLLAGAVPWLEHADPPYRAIYVRALGDPAQVIRDAVQRELADTDLPANGSLVSFLATATKRSGHRLIIVLDQFEEFFIRLSPQFREAFIAELGAIYDARTVPVKLVMSLREDWLAAISQIEQRIPEVFRTKLWVLPLTSEQARQAIVSPVERLGLRYEPGLVERLLSDLGGVAGSDVMPPQLQLVCTALYNKLGPDERVITMAAYDRLGGARGVLRRYLDDELARFGHDERTLAQGALEELVTSEGTKAVKTGEELALGLEIEAAKLLPVLEKLVRARLLRLIEREDGATAFELAHEYLIHEIGLAEEAKERKKVEELIAQEVENWQRFQTLLGADKLARINEVRELLHLGGEAQELLLRSALQVGYDTDYWLNRVADPRRRVALLAETTTSKVAVVRQRAAAVLGTQDVADSVEPLLTLALHDTDISVRETARASVAKLIAQRLAIIARLQSELKSADRRLRQAVLRALAVLPLRDLPADVRAPVMATRARQRATWLAEQSVATPLRRALGLTAGLLMALLAVAYVVSINSYFVDIKVSEATNSIVVNRGNPWLTLPGMWRPVVDTGLDESQLAEAGRRQIVNKELMGFWKQLSSDADPPYQRWAQDVISALNPTGSAPMLWYLNRQKDATEELLKPIESESTDTRRWVAESLGQLGKVNPTLADARIINALHLLIHDKEAEVRLAAIQSLKQVVQINPKLTTTDVITDLLPLLGDKNQDVIYGTCYALSDMLGANPAVITPGLAKALMNEIESTKKRVDCRALDLLNDAVASNPAIATPELATLLQPFLRDSDPIIQVSTKNVLLSMIKLNAALATTNLAETLWSLLRSGTIGEPEMAADLLVAIIHANPAFAAPDRAEALQQLLQNDEADVRSAAATVLNAMVIANPKLATSGLAAAVRERLQDKDNTVRIAALAVFQELIVANPPLAGEMLPSLYTQLRSPDNATRSNATAALRQAIDRAPAVVTPELAGLLRSLARAADSDVRDEALDTLDQAMSANEGLASPDLALAFRQLLHDPDGTTRARALSSLKRIVEINPGFATSDLVGELLKLSRSSADDTIPDIHRALQQIISSNPALATSELLAALRPFLLDRALSDSYRSYGDYYTIETLVQMSEANESIAPEVVAMLRPLLQDPDSNVRGVAASAIGQVGTVHPALAAPILADLTSLLHDQDSEIRSDAIRFIASLGASDAAAATQAVTSLRPLLEDSDSSAQFSAAQALMEVLREYPALATPEVVAPIWARFRDDVRVPSDGQSSALALAAEKPTEMTHDTFVAMLHILLHNKNSTVQATAAYVLERWAISESISYDSLTRDEAVAAAADLRMLLPDATSTVRYYAIGALVRIATTHKISAPGTLQSLNSLLNDNEGTLRAAGARALGEVISVNPALASPEALNSLGPLLQDSDGNVRAAAASAIQQVLAANPTLATSSLVDDLGRKWSAADSDTRTILAEVLARAGAVNPTLAATIATTLGELPHPGSRRDSPAPPDVLDRLGPSKLNLTDADVIRAANAILEEQDDIATYGANLVSLIATSKRTLATPELAATLRGLLSPDHPKRMRLIAAYSLRKIVALNPALANAELTTALCEVLQDSDNELRITAIHDLAQLILFNRSLATAELAADLATLAQAQAQDAILRAAAADLLSQIASANPRLFEKSSADLRALLHDQSALVRASAAAGLARIARGSALSADTIADLRMLLEDPDSVARASAAAALGQVASASAPLGAEITAALIPLLQNQDSDVQLAGLQSLLQVAAADQSAITTGLALALPPLLADTTDDVRANAADLLGYAASANPDLSADLATPLYPLLQNQDDLVRAAAARALGQIGVANPKLAKEIVGDLLALFESSLKRGDDNNLGPATRYAFMQVLKTQPELVADAVTYLDRALRNQQSTGRIAIFRALEQIGLSSPVAARQVFDLLMTLHLDNEAETSSNLDDSLERIALHNPDLALQVANRWLDRSSDRYSSESYHLRNMLAVNSGLASQLAISATIGLNASERHARLLALKGQALIAEIDPMLVTPQAIEGITKLIADPSNELAQLAIDTLATMIQNQPTAATAAAGRALIGALANNNLNHSSVMGALGQAIEANSALATPEAAAAFHRFLQDSDADVRQQAAQGLQQALTLNPLLATHDMQTELQPLLQDRRSDIRSSAIGLLSQIYATQVLSGSETIDSLFTKLTSPMNPLERGVAARALFLLSLKDSLRDRDIRDRLALLVQSTDPLAQLWSNRTSALLEAADLGHSAAALEMSQRASIGEALQGLRDMNASNSADDSSQKTTLFGEDFRWSAGAAFDWLSDLEAKQNRAQASAAP